MIINYEDIKKSIGGDYCSGCPFFSLDIYETRDVAQLGCEHEEMCAALYGHALDKARDRYEVDVMLP